MQGRKIIKKIVQLTGILLLIIFAFPATAYVLLQSSNIQTKAANYVMRMVSEKLNTPFTISKIDISFLYRVRLNDVYLQDLSGDTMIFVESFTIGLRHVNPFNRQVSVGSLNLDKALFALTIDSASNLNLNYFIDKLRGNGQGKGSWNVRFSNLRIRNSRFSLRNYYFQPVDYGMNFSDINAFSINADVKRFTPSKDSLSFFIKSLAIKEQSGLVLENLTGDFSQAKTFLCFRDVLLKTPRSEIKGDEISLRFSSYSAFKPDSFVRSVRLMVDLSKASIDMGDIGYFAPVFRNLHQQISFSGLVTGPVNNLRGKELVIGFGDNSKLLGNIQLEGLPKIRETFILANIKELSTTNDDIEKLQFSADSHIRLPEIIEKLGLVTYKGNYTGFIDDFVAYGKFSTALGVLNTDLLFRPDTSNMLSFEGRLNARDFNLGTLLNASELIGNVSLTANISGATLRGKSIDASLKGVIEHFEFRKYDYTNISLSGNLQNKMFDGSVNIHDPNIDLEFLGKVNLSDSVPAFDFTANITDANLYALNINKSDPDFRVSCFLSANARGNSINNLNGEIKLLNSLFVKKEKQLQIYDLSILSRSSSGHNHLQLRSEFMDADLDGNFELTKSGETLKQFLVTYLPSLIDSSGMNTESLKNTIDFRSTIKNVKPLFEFFLPEYSIAENSLLNLSFEPGNRALHMHFQTSRAEAKGLVWNNLNLLVNGNGNELDMEAGSENILLGNSARLENFTVMAGAANDTTGIFLRWNNWQDIQHKGTISALARFTRPAGSRNHHMDINFNPSGFQTNDTLWTIQPGRVSIDSTTIRFDNVAIQHELDYFRIDGAISENPSDEVNIRFHHFNLGNLNGITAASGVKLGGLLSGKATLSGLYKSPMFTSLMEIDSLVINNEMLGGTHISSTWDDKRKAILLDAYALRDKLKTINIKGEYWPTEQGKLAFKLELEKLRLNIFNPYVKVIFGDLRGIASGRATLSGTIKKPVLNGELTLQKTSFKVNYLQTRYNFSEKVQIENNNFYFKNIRIYDPKGNSAYLTGAIRNKYLRNFVFDLAIRPEEFLCLNTTMADNKVFYGTAYATGLIEINGPPKNIVIDIWAKTNKGTSISIPLSNTGELNEYSFITIEDLRSGIPEQPEVSDYQVDLTGLQINFVDLEITPDAEVQIIFDQKLGDIIKGRGRGNLDMKINTSSNFIMYGEFTIEKGEYLFTLQNIINKKLTIEPGGIIRWSGDPLDATIDIVANYRIRASLGDLFGTDGDLFGIDADQKIEVYDRITMTGRLMSPDIKYEVYPNTDESTRLSINSRIATSEEMNRQFFSLLTLNRFSLSQNPGGQSSSGSSTYSGAAGVSASEFLSNQLSNALSKAVNDLDVDINYRSNRELKSDEVQLALSYQMFNNRLTINGSVDMATNAAAAARKDVVGEFDIDYKLTKNGKLRLKTYNHANNDLLYETSTYTQGFGFIYKEEFNTLGELWRRYFSFPNGKKEEPVTPDAPDGK